MDTTDATISRHETGERRSDDNYLAALAEALNCHPADFWRDPGQPTADELLRDLTDEQRAHAIQIIRTFKAATH